LREVFSWLFFLLWQAYCIWLPHPHLERAPRHDLIDIGTRGCDPNCQVRGSRRICSHCRQRHIGKVRRRNYRCQIVSASVAPDGFLHSASEWICASATTTATERRPRTTAVPALRQRRSTAPGAATAAGVIRHDVDRLCCGRGRTVGPGAGCRDSRPHNCLRGRRCGQDENCEKCFHRSSTPCRCNLRCHSRNSAP
jgi:hypothetical protein